jgi:hypothetical protein
MENQADVLLTVSSGSNWGGSTCLVGDDPSEEYVGLGNMSCDSFITDCDESLSQLGSTINFGEQFMDDERVVFDEREEDIEENEDSGEIILGLGSRVILCEEDDDDGPQEGFLGLLQRAEKQDQKESASLHHSAAAGSGSGFLKPNSLVSSGARKRSNRNTSRGSNTAISPVSGEAHKCLRILIVEDNDSKLWKLLLLSSSRQNKQLLCYI